MDTVLGALAIICLLVIIMHLLHDREGFTSSDPLVYRVDMSKDTFVIYDGLQTNMQRQLISKFPSFRVTKDADAKTGANAFVSDMFEAKASRLPLLTALPYKKHVFVCTANNKLQTFEQIGSGATLYVMDASSRDIANAMFDRKVTIKEVSSINDTMTTQGLIMIYDTVDNATRRLSNLSAPLSVLDYNKPPEHWSQSKVSFPYLYTEDVDVNIIFKDVAAIQKQRFPIRKVWTFDVFLTIRNGPEHELYDFVTQEALRDEFAKTNYYSMFLSMHIVTKTYLQRYNAHISRRDDLPILEQYTEAATYETRRNVPGHLEGDVFHPRDVIIEGVPLIEGMLFTMAAQDRVSERGVYIVGVDGKLTRQRRIGQDPEGIFRCYGDANAKTQKDCEAAWDPFGNRKSVRGIWDRPCATDDECPFYQANKEYPNYRGGCLDGLCEMPIGVRRTSYRTYDKTSKPFCHNCPSSDPTCCKGKGDIAFDMDVHERGMHAT